MYRCAGKQCGGLFGNIARVFLYPSDAVLHYGNSSSGDVADTAFAGTQDPRYIAMRRVGPQGEAYVSLFVATNDFSIVRETHGRTLALLDIVVSTKMKTGMVTVDAATMAAEMTKTGHVAVYGILFDTDKAVLRPESDPTLGEIAKLLKQEPSMSLYVVGHSDNTGAFDHNLSLSERRAAAVVDALRTRFGIAQTRLRPMGVGPVSPVASNATEDGRARNRRVELVRQ
jgi:outer membrane protein OmpA-like peptidoglycan-associated protein